MVDRKEVQSREQSRFLLRSQEACGERSKELPRLMGTAVWRRRDLASKRSDEYGKVTHFSVALSTKKLYLDLFYRKSWHHVSLVEP